MYALVVTSHPPHREALPLVGYEVPSVVAVSNSLISVNCRIRSAAAAGLSRRRSSSQLCVVQRTGRLLTIARDERHRRTAIEQRHSGIDLLLTNAERFRDPPMNGC